MIRSTVALVTALLLLCSCVFATGFQTPGIGVKARGMGGAFRAVADNWTAAYYNPAGYAFLADNQIGFSQGFSHPRDELTPSYTLSQGQYSYDFGVYTDTLYNEHKILSMPSGGFAVKLPLFNEIVWGLSAFQPFDNNLTWTVWQPLAAFNNTLGENLPKDQFKSDIDVIAFQMTTAKSFNDDKMSVGVGLQLLKVNIWMRDFIVRPNPEWDQRPKDIIIEVTNDRGEAWGFGLNLGFMYKINDKMTLGLTGTLPTSIDIDGESRMRYVVPMANTTEQTMFLGGGTATEILTLANFTTKLKLPGIYGLGLSYKVNEKLLLDLDVEYTTWSDFEGFSFKYSDFVLSNDMKESSDPDFFRPAGSSNPTKWENAGKVALGAHYASTEVVSFMGGVSVEQSALRKTMYYTPWFVDTGTRYGFSGGLMLSFERWELGLVTSFYSSPDDKNITWTADADGDGYTDSFPGLYKAATIETLMSVNYRF